MLAVCSGVALAAYVRSDVVVRPLALVLGLGQNSADQRAIPSAAAVRRAGGALGASERRVVAGGDGAVGSVVRASSLPPPPPPPSETDELPPKLVEGLIHVREMDGYWEYDERRYTLVSKSTGRRIRVGDACRVRIEAAEPETRRVNLAFVEMPGGIEGKPKPSGSRTSSRQGKRTTRGARPKGRKRR